jgi:hypothetical protein
MARLAISQPNGFHVRAMRCDATEMQVPLAPTILSRVDPKH